MVGEWVRIPTGNLQKEIRLPRVLAWEGRPRSFRSKTASKKEEAMVRFPGRSFKHLACPSANSVLGFDTRGLTPMWHPNIHHTKISALSYVTVCAFKISLRPLNPSLLPRKNIKWVSNTVAANLAGVAWHHDFWSTKAEGVQNSDAIRTWPLT